MKEWSEYLGLCIYQIIWNVMSACWQLFSRQCFWEKNINFFSLVRQGPNVSKNATGEVV